MHLHGEVLPGIEQLDQQRERFLLGQRGIAHDHPAEPIEQIVQGLALEQALGDQGSLRVAAPAARGGLAEVGDLPRLADPLVRAAGQRPAELLLQCPAAPDLRLVDRHELQRIQRHASASGAGRRACEAFLTPAIAPFYSVGEEASRTHRRHGDGSVPEPRSAR